MGEALHGIDNQLKKYVCEAGHDGETREELPKTCSDKDKSGKICGKPVKEKSWCTN